jgi:poly(3-hydroxybutyrate) depolymerase
MSAGACLGAALALRHAKLFAAAGLHSAMPCGAARNAATAMQAMSSGPQRDVGSIAQEARAQAPARALPLPVCIIHGEQDRIVAARNATELLRQFLIFNGRPTANGIADADARTVTPLADGRTVTRDDYVLADRVVARSIRVTALGHAWSGGDDAFAYNDREPPDATALFGEFFDAQLGRRHARTVAEPRESIGEER